MTKQEFYKQVIEQLKNDPSEYVNYLMQFNDKKLEKMLVLTKQQKQMAFDQKNHLSFELLSLKEDIIIQVRLLKFEENNYYAKYK
jgi:hypothetical protein